MIKPGNAAPETTQEAERMDNSQQSSAISNAKRPFTETYRLSHVPMSFTIAQVKELFSVADQSLILSPVSLANSVYDPELQEKVATITFSEKPSFARNLSSQDPNAYEYLTKLIPSPGNEAHRIRIDSSFDGLAPLNEVDVDQETVDIVASTGLADRAFGSWQHEKGTMWLRDILPRDLPGSRVWIWGKRSELLNSRSHGDVTHYRDSLLEDLIKIRRTAADRRQPLILIGHSFGGILIKAAFVKSFQDATYYPLRDTIGGLVFFGTPHEGIHNRPWVDLWGDDPPQKLIRDLGPGSSFLRDLREDFGRYLRDEKVLALFELQETPTAQENDKGKIDKKGPPALMIDEKAACVNHPNETRVPVHEDHSKIAKLSGAERVYYTIKDHLRVMVAHARETVAARTRKIHALCVLSGIQGYLQYMLTMIPRSDVLLMAETSDLQAVCWILRNAGDVCWVHSHPCPASPVP